MIKKIDHIGIAVENLADGISRWVDCLGFKKGAEEEIPERKVKVVSLLQSGIPDVELISPLGEDSPVARFLSNRGEGIHHICFEVQDIREEMEAMRARGVEFIQAEPVAGAEESRIAFIHPKSLNGVLIELKQKK